MSKVANSPMKVNLIETFLSDLRLQFVKLIQTIAKYESTY